MEASKLKANPSVSIGRISATSGNIANSAMPTANGQNTNDAAR